VRNINKRIFLNTLVCPTLGWEIRRGAVQHSHSVADQFKLDQGREVGERAREVFAEGILIDEVSLTKAAERTNGLINDSKISVIYQTYYKKQE